MNQPKDELKDLILATRKRKRNKWIDNLQTKLQSTNNEYLAMNQSILSPPKYQFKEMTSVFGSSIRRNSLTRKLTLSDYKYKPHKIKSEKVENHFAEERNKTIERLQQIKAFNTIGINDVFLNENLGDMGIISVDKNERIKTKIKTQFLEPRLWEREEGKLKTPFEEGNSVKRYKFPFRERTVYKTNFMKIMPYQKNKLRHQRKTYSSTKFKLKNLDVNQFKIKKNNSVVV